MTGDDYVRAELAPKLTTTYPNARRDILYGNGAPLYHTHHSRQQRPASQLTLPHAVFP